MIELMITLTAVFVPAFLFGQAFFNFGHTEQEMLDLLDDIFLKIKGKAIIFTFDKELKRHVFKWEDAQIVLFMTVDSKYYRLSLLNQGKEVYYLFDTLSKNLIKTGVQNRINPHTVKNVEFDVTHLSNEIDSELVEIIVDFFNSEFIPMKENRKDASIEMRHQYLTVVG